VLVVVDCILDRRVGVLADVQTEDAFLVLIELRRLHIRHEGVDPAIVESHAVDDRVLGWQAEDARFGIARLRARRDGAHFD
jgi:hypothetical protein